jgi:large subunit ribosomal protein L23
MSRIYDILVRPLYTEKVAAAEAFNKYGFEVRVDANKHAIREAVEAMFDVKVAEVRTAVVPGKRKRFGRTFGKRSTWKKAIVTLRDGYKIDFGGEDTEEVTED